MFSVVTDIVSNVCISTHESSAKERGKNMPSNGEELKHEALIMAPEKSDEAQHFEYLQRLAKLFAMSGLFADIKGVSETQALAQAFTKIALGEGMGLTPAESMTGLSIIQGRIAVNAEIRGARMQRSGLSWDILELSDQGCWLLLKKGDTPVTTRVKDKEGKEYDQPAIVSFTADEARIAGLLDKDNYKKWRQDMMFARALTRLQRRFAPGVLGAVVLTEEEITSDPALHAPVELKAKNSLQAVKDKYKKSTIERPPTEQTPVTAGAETAPAAATTRPEAGKSAENPSVQRVKEPSSPPASKLTQQLKQSIKQEASGKPEGFEFPEDAW
jgi:hypothetical protein